MREEQGLYGASMADLARWDLENPAEVVLLEIGIRVWPDDLKCDVCGETADTIHFLDVEDGTYPKGGPVTVRFACADHDFGLYFVDVARFVDRKREESFATHIARKDWGLYGLAALRDRLWEIERDRKIADGVLK